MKFVESAASERARRGRLETPHGSVETPAFMPVGTRGAVRMLDSRDLAEAGSEMVLANTYHLMLRPGAEVVADLGGLHGFMGWPGPILTDSGGYQVFSLEPTITEDGAEFRSTYDGTSITMTPEESMRVQELLGADIAMVFDELVGLPAERAAVAAAMERTLRWSQRAVESHSRRDQALFGICQGGVDPELRAESARRTADLGFVGYGIGGLSVGESSHDRDVALDAAIPELPQEAPRYVMGLGDTEGVLAAVARGADLFDCVWPTRLARHGKVLSPSGDYSIRRAEFASDDSPLDPECGCRTCAVYSRGHLRHLRLSEKMSSMRPLSIHNLHYTLEVMAGARRAIEEDSFDLFHSQVVNARASGAQ
ncbi:MAG: tRNA guanosine(34) transglycosylase Tgt [Acidimicrobiia bacterium]|nr:tRNA guanosine(34) transglycosylase Tgt [Acidimicrobiia bacterium]